MDISSLVNIAQQSQFPTSGADAYLRAFDPTGLNTYFASILTPGRLNFTEVGADMSVSGGNLIIPAGTQFLVPANGQLFLVTCGPIGGSNILVPDPGGVAWWVMQVIGQPGAYSVQVNTATNATIDPLNMLILGSESDGFGTSPLLDRPSPLKKYYRNVQIPDLNNGGLGAYSYYCVLPAGGAITRVQFVQADTTTSTVLKVTLLDNSLPTGAALTVSGGSTGTITDSGELTGGSSGYDNYFPEASSGSYANAFIIQGDGDGTSGVSGEMQIEITQDTMNINGTTAGMIAYLNEWEANF